VAALKAADLVGTLSGSGPFTVFAPNNAAFAKIPEATLNGLLADVPALKAVLLRHVVPANIPVSISLKKIFQLGNYLEKVEVYSFLGLLFHMEIMMAILTQRVGIQNVFFVFSIFHVFSTKSALVHGGALLLVR